MPVCSHASYYTRTVAKGAVVNDVRRTIIARLELVIVVVKGCFVLSVIQPLCKDAAAKVQVLGVVP